MTGVVLERPGVVPAAIGVDAGSTTCKIVAVDEGCRIVAHVIEPMSPRVAEQVVGLLTSVREACAVDETAASGIPVVATGYGRKLVTAAGTVVTEITCHARGVHAATGSAGTLVDIGGQDSKVVRVGKNGAAVDFAMNDKCAAGTGRFLEHTAHRLGLDVADIGPLAVAADRDGRTESITSTCTVFAESEIISLVAGGAEVDAILAGLHRGLVSRITAMVRTVGLTPPLLLSGGVARNQAVVTLLSELTGTPVTVPDHPQLMGAYGAAILGAGGLAVGVPVTEATGEPSRIAAPSPRSCDECGADDTTAPVGDPSTPTPRRPARTSVPFLRRRG